MRQEVTSSAYIVEVDLDAAAILPPESEERSSRAVILFGYHPEDDREPPLLEPFPITSHHLSEDESAKLNDWMTSLLRPALAERLRVEEGSLRFPPFQDIAPALTPFLRHETGYSLLILAGKEFIAPQRFREAMRNTGNTLLMSVGVNWHIPESQLPQLEDAYAEHFQPALGPIPSQVHPDVFGINLQLEAMKDAGEVRMTQDFPDIANLGHGLIYMIERTFRQGGDFEIVVTGIGAPPDYGTPIEASSLALNLP